MRRGASRRDTRAVLTVAAPPKQRRVHATFRRDECVVGGIRGAREAGQLYAAKLLYVKSARVAHTSSKQRAPVRSISCNGAFACVVLHAQSGAGCRASG